MKASVLAIALVGCLGIGFGSGLLVGRQFPVHHYVRFGNVGRLLLDPATGRVCDPWNDPTATPVMVPDGPPDANGFQPMKKQQSWPICDK